MSAQATLGQMLRLRDLALCTWLGRGTNPRVKWGTVRYRHLLLVRRIPKRFQVLDRLAKAWMCERFPVKVVTEGWYGWIFNRAPNLSRAQTLRQHPDKPMPKRPLHSPTFKAPSTTYGKPNDSEFGDILP